LAILSNHFLAAHQEGIVIVREAKTLLFAEPEPRACLTFFPV
jgi:hypothetical protein